MEKGSDRENINIIVVSVTVNNIMDVVISTFLLSCLLDISFAITTGSDNCVRFIKKIMVGFININKPIASTPTTLVVVTFAMVAIIFTITLRSTKETKDFNNGLFFKNNSPFLIENKEKKWYILNWSF